MNTSFFQSHWYRLAFVLPWVGLVVAVTHCYAVDASLNRHAPEFRKPEVVSAELQEAFYRGDLNQLIQRRTELENLLQVNADVREQGRTHYYVGLGWRHQAWLAADVEKKACYSQAVKHFEKAAELNPKDGASHALAAHVFRSLVGLGQRDHETIHGAISHRESAYEIAPTDPRVLSMEAYALIAIPEDRGGNIEEGLATGFEAVGRYQFFDSDPSDIGAAFNWYLLGIGFQKQQKNEQALAAFKKALQHRPQWKVVQNLVKGLENTN